MNNSQSSIPQVVQQQQHPPQPNQAPMMQGQHNNFANQSQPQSTAVGVQNVQPNQQTHTSTNQSTQQEIINKTRKLINDLKVSLANLMNLLAKNISYNYQIDSGQKINTESSRFDKAWGEFNSICNQVETHFKTLQECALLKKDNKNYIPYDLSPLGQIESQPNTITYNQYVNLVKNQVNYSKAVQEILTEGARKISQMELTPMSQQHMHNQQHNYQLQNQQKSAMINQMTPNSYHTNQMQMAAQSPMMSGQQSINNQMNTNQMNTQMMMQQQQQSMQRGSISQMNTNQMPVQQPMMQPMNNQMNSMQQATYQQMQPQSMNNQMKPQYIPHNQMQ